MPYWMAIAGLNAALAGYLWPIAGGGRRAGAGLSFAWLASIAAAAGSNLPAAAWLAALALAAPLAALALPKWREAVGAMPGCRMISAHLLRAPLGVALWMMGSHGLLPSEFANRVGTTAVVTGVLTPLAVWAIQEGHRWLAVIWNGLGLLDLAYSIRMGAEVLGPACPSGVLALLSFTAPALLVLHLYLFWKLAGRDKFGACDSSALLFASNR